MANGQNHGEVDKLLIALADRLARSVRELKRSYTLDPFAYSIEIDLNASATATGSFLVQNDSAFAICATTYLTTSQADAAIAEFQPFGSGLTTGLVPVIVQLTDTGSGRILSDARIPIDSLFGTAQRPFWWPHYKILDPSSSFQASLQNLSATAQTLRLVFHGYKIFANTQQGLEAFKISR